MDGDLPDLAGADLSDVGPAWMTVLDNRWQGCEQTHYIEQLAARWLEAVHILERLGPRVRLVRYEDFVKDTNNAINAAIDDGSLAAGRLRAQAQAARAALHP